MRMKGPALLTHPNPLIRALAGWLVGMVVFVVAWALSYALLPEGFFGFFPRMGAVSADVGQGILSLAWEIFVNNIFVNAVVIGLASLLAMGCISGGYLIAWFVCGSYGGMLGTNSFTYPDPGGPMAPYLAVIWERSGTREITAYLLTAAALANIHLWRDPSLRSSRLERVRRLREVRLSLGEILLVVVAVLLIAWGAYVEAWQIVHSPSAFVGERS